MAQDIKRSKNAEAAIPPYAPELTPGVTIEVVPPAGPDPQPLLKRLEPVARLEIQGFSVATNPVAKPRMNALAFCSQIQQKLEKPAILHCTTRDYNRLGLQSLLWGARALGIETLLVTTGDFVGLSDRQMTTTVRDMDVFDLIEMARESGLRTGCVVVPVQDPGRMDKMLPRLERKKAAGAQFAVTQPIYDVDEAKSFLEATSTIGLPIVLGILPLYSARHASFLHHKVSGIYVPKTVRKRLEQAADPVAEGIANAREILAVARDADCNTCIMPPFEHFEILNEILK